MKISVAMAVYNGRKYIGEQIASIVNQTLKPEEVVFVDDASTEPCEDIIDSYETSQIKFIQLLHEKNQGYGPTFFEALMRTTGDIIFLADQDDVWVLDKIKKMTDEMRKNPSILCLSCKNIIVDGKGEKVKAEKPGKSRLEKVDINSLIKQKKLRPGMTLAISRRMRDLLRDINTTPFVSHDRLIEFIACKKDGFYILDEYLNFYRIHGQNTSGMNLTYHPRTGLEGRILQAKKERTYLESLITVFGMEPGDNLYEICRRTSDFYFKREKLMRKGNLFFYIWKILPDINKFNTVLILFGDLYCLYNPKVAR